LLRADRPVHLTPKAFELLTVLIENRPRAVPKTELVERVWPNTFVSDSSLARAIRELRSALGDDAYNSNLIRTIHAFGYAFTGNVVEVSEGAKRQDAVGGDCYWIISGSRDFALTEGENLVCLTS
jgi:DNA-binding winged helix-turn-helix (wHTH) protein